MLSVARLDEDILHDCAETLPLLLLLLSEGTETEQLLQLKVHVADHGEPQVHHELPC